MTLGLPKVEHRRWLILRHRPALGRVANPSSLDDGTKLVILGTKLRALGLEERCAIVLSHHDGKEQ
jgi:hypothetical protein